jgi:hypothetical protein
VFRIWIRTDPQNPNSGSGSVLGLLDPDRDPEYLLLHKFTYFPVFFRRYKYLVSPGTIKRVKMGKYSYLISLKRGYNDVNPAPHSTDTLDPDPHYDFGLDTDQRETNADPNH